MKNNDRKKDCIYIKSKQKSKFDFLKDLIASTGKNF